MLFFLLAIAVLRVILCNVGKSFEPKGVNEEYSQESVEVELLELWYMACALFMWLEMFEISHV